MHSTLHTRIVLKQIKADRRVELREIPGRWSNPDCEVGVKFSGMKLIGANVSETFRNLHKAMKNYKDHLCSGNPPRPQQLLDRHLRASGALSVALDVRRQEAGPGGQRLLHLGIFEDAQRPRHGWVGWGMGDGMHLGCTLGALRKKHGWLWVNVRDYSED